MTSTAVKSKINYSDVLPALVFMALGILLLINSYSISALAIGGVDLTSTYPRVLSILLIVFSMIVIISSLVRSWKKDENAEDEADEESKVEENSVQEQKNIRFRLISFMLILVAYVLLMRYVGYFEMGFVFLVASIYFLGETTKKWLLKSIMIAAVATLVIYFVFGYLLNIYVPGGLIFRT